jgi:hypothetical protein
MILCLVERLGITGDDCHMDVMVSGQNNNNKKGFHALHSLLDYDFIFICCSFFCVWRTGSVRTLWTVLHLEIEQR